MHQFLEMAAFVAAGVIFVLLLVVLVGRLSSGGRMPRQAQILQFRRSMKRLDSVVDRWAMELHPRPRRRPDELAVDPYRPEPRPDRDS